MKLTRHSTNIKKKKNYSSSSTLFIVLQFLTKIKIVLVFFILKKSKIKQYANFANLGTFPSEAQEDNKYSHFWQQSCQYYSSFTIKYNFKKNF